MPSSGRILPLIAGMYCVSGALGLVYEVAFNTYLASVFGEAAYAPSAVLVAFMGGLALGAHAASRLDPRLRRPLLAYGVAEIVIGFFCLAAPHMFAFLAHATHGMLRAGLAVLVVLIPAAGMGATLPLLARFVASDNPALRRRSVARLYALNTLGGALGSLGSAYLVVPGFGVAWTMRGSAAVSVTIGALAIALGRRTPRASRDIAPAGVAAPIILPLSGDETAHAMPWRDARVLSAASGLLVFGCEVVFAKLLGSVVGTSAYAFGLMLAIFLVCLSLGTPLASRLARSFGASAAAVGLAASGITLAASLAVWDRLPALFVALGPFVQTWGGRETIRGLAALAVLVLPVVAMGTTFPLALRAARHATVGADVGRLTVANTLGSIAGSIAFGFQILPRLDANRSLLAIAIMYLALAGFAIRHRRPSSAPAAGGASGSSKRVAIDLGDG